MSTWLAAIVLNTARVQLRRRRRLMHVSLDDRPEGENNHSLLDCLADGRPIAEDAFRKSESRAHLMQLMQKLRPSLRTACQLRNVEGLTLREIGCALGVTQSAVKARIFRARVALKDLAMKREVGHSAFAASRRLNNSRRNSSLIKVD
jgi:RNA polymerase sigma-70 factor (ECF subfamily)